MKVVNWISLEQAKGHDESIGGLGGWVDGETWRVYLDCIKDEHKEYYEALREAIVARKLRYTGYEHQNATDGVPLFSDNTIGSFSFRAWGDLMAAIYNTEEDANYSYIDFYC